MLALAFSAHDPNPTPDPTLCRYHIVFVRSQLAELHGDPPAKDLLLEGATRTDRILLPVRAAGWDAHKTAH